MEGVHSEYSAFIRYGAPFILSLAIVLAIAHVGCQQRWAQLLFVKDDSRGHDCENSKLSPLKVGALILVLYGLTVGLMFMVQYARAGQLKLREHKGSTAVGEMTPEPGMPPDEAPA